MDGDAWGPDIGELAHYRLYRAPEATWVYAELFTSQADAESFCKAAGGFLAAPTQQDFGALTKLLATTLAPKANTTAAPVTGIAQPGYANFGKPDFDLALWVGIKAETTSSGTVWRTMSGQALNSTAWATGQPVGVGRCAVMGWIWDKGTNSSTANSETVGGLSGWYAAYCDTAIGKYGILEPQAASVRPLPALCKVPFMDKAGLPNPPGMVCCCQRKSPTATAVTSVLLCWAGSCFFTQ